jgi:16S rRNA (cytidine1402-2'-O)-methyltransferase
LVLGGAPPIAQSTLNDVELTEQLQQLLNQGISASDAARQLAATTGLSRRRLYTLLHQDASD